MKVSDLEWPPRREEAIQYLHDISKVDEKSKRIELESLDFAFHFFLDDFDFLEHPSGAVGLFLYSDDEAVEIGKVAHSLEKMLAKHGRLRDNHFYVGTSEWQEVVNSANAALQELKRRP